MLPLGDLWSGICLAVPGGPSPPDEATLRLRCNLGYARGCCGRFPGSHGPDAVRFAIRSDDGLAVRVSYVLECGHRPFAHGSLEYRVSAAAFTDRPAEDPIAVQACAYVRSYLRRKAEAFAR